MPSDALPPTAAAGPRRGTYAVVLAAVLAAAALLRLGAMRSEFWFDEIWSWEFARAAASPWQVFAGVGQHHDNNHKLNTLLLSLYPEGAGWWWYRLHSLAAGLAAVALAAAVAGRRGRPEAVFAAVLFAADYWLVLCSAEARGYAPAVAFALLALYALQGYFASGRRRMLGLFWLAAVLGFCSHLTFIHCYLALGVWSVYHLARRRRSGGDELRQVLRCHAVPGLFFAALYLLDVRHMRLGGGPPLPTSLVVGRLLSLGLGGPPSAAWFLPVALAAVVLAAGLRLLARDGQHVGLFFAVAVVGSPALFLLGRPVYLFERYFLISFVFFLLLFSYVLGALWRHSRAGAAIASLVTLGVVTGSVGQVMAFERGGRGHFREALACIDRASPEGTVRLCGDSDFRVRKFFDFYAPYAGGGGRFVYCEQEELPAGGADWLLVHRLDDLHPPEPRMFDSDGNAYERAAEFPAAFGGWGWYVYRNAVPAH